MAGSTVALLDRPEPLRAALSPIRRRLLDRLRTPASATELSVEMSLGRQRLNYHLRELEKAGLVHLVEQRQRRGFVERVMAARADAFVIDPSMMGAAQTTKSRAAAQDRFSAEHLIDTAGSIVRNVTRMRARASEEGTRLLTFSIDTEISFATPEAFERFTTELSESLARHAAQFNAPGGRRYRVVIAGHPGVHHGRSRDRRNPRRRPH
jgi:DNA-binding transcriptional ArsR family regulator